MALDRKIYSSTARRGDNDAAWSGPEEPFHRRHMVPLVCWIELAGLRGRATAGSASFEQRYRLCAKALEIDDGNECGLIGWADRDAASKDHDPSTVVADQGDEAIAWCSPRPSATPMDIRDREVTARPDGRGKTLRRCVGRFWVADASAQASGSGDARRRQASGHF
jgi:hypothetical protein